MNEEYSAYLNSEAWKKKRMQRLGISQFRCSACADSRAVHVHHLTYERIFDEDMADLLPLCSLHHKTIEDLISRGEIPRRGDVLFLASETIRLILGGSVKAKEKATNRAKGVKLHRERKQSRKALKRARIMAAAEMAAKAAMKDTNPVVLTRELLKAVASSGCGFNRAQLSILGVSWPPKKGWLSARIGTQISSFDYARLCALRGSCKNRNPV